MIEMIPIINSNNILVFVDILKFTNIHQSERWIIYYWDICELG